MMDNPNAKDIGRFKPYPKYKDSGVEWLGEIPEGWEIRRLKFIAQLIMGQSPPSEICNELGDGVPFLQGNAEFGKEHPTPRLFCPNPGKCAPAGSHLISVRAPVGALNTADQEYGIGRGLCAIRPLQTYLENRFARYMLTAVKWQLDAMSTGSTYEAVSADDVSDFLCVFPSLTEQKAVAIFLDRETAKIDALIAKKERLIELLREKRTALITRAVTKGLDSNVPMKPSGIEWLGEMPAHWHLFPFTKYLAEKSDYRGKTPEKVSDGVFLVTAKNVRMGFIDYECSEEYVAEEEYEEIMRRGLPKKGDILFTTEAPLGNVALVDREHVALAQRIIRFRMNPKHFESRFTLYAMMSSGFQIQLQCLSTGSTAEGLKASKLPGLQIVAPPLPEQRAIAVFLDRETAKIDALVGRLREVIERLKEYRTALISAAVTGKIDVREEGA